MSILDWEYQWQTLTSNPRYAAASWVDHKGSDGQEGRLVTLSDVSLPPGWELSSATIAFWVNRYFPCVAPQGFWTKEEVYLKGRGLPQLTRAGYVDCPNPEGFQWLWLHWPRVWSPIGDTLLTYAHFVRMRFQSLK